MPGRHSPNSLSANNFSRPIDWRGGITYRFAAMNRLLLTFLALLAGLLAQGGPATARECRTGASQVGALEVPLEQIRVAAKVQANSGPKARREVLVRESGCRKPPVTTVYLPTVQLGPDRARE